MNEAPRSATRSATRATIAHNIKLAIAQRYKKKRRAVYFEIGVNKRGRLRADIFVMAMTGHIVIVEVKSSVADFRADKKMDGYLEYCNQFYLAVPKPVYQKIKDEIMPQAGIFIMSEDGAHVRKLVKKARNRPLEPTVAHNLAIRAAFRNSDTNNRKNVRA
jgi:hypothetical protein